MIENLTILGAQEGSAKLGAVVFAGACLCVIGASAVTLYSMFLHLHNYRRPDLQRAALRIQLMYSC